MMWHRLRARRRAADDRGIALVEMAIVAPFLALIFAGTVEYGMLWRDDLTVTSSTRASARVVSNLGQSHLADFEALLSLDAALSSANGITIEGVLIYDASAADGQPHSSCFDLAGDPRDSVGFCNHYSAADLSLVSGLDCSSGCPAYFPDNGNCAGGLTTYYCPMDDRSDDQASGVSEVGVWVRVNRSYFTGIFPGDGVTITDFTVMNVEPQ